MNIELAEANKKESKSSPHKQRPLQWLRDATSEWRQSVDCLLVVKQWLAAKVTKQDYQPFIIGAFKTFSNLDHQLNQALANHVSLANYVPRLAAISSDIHALNSHWPELALHIKQVAPTVTAKQGGSQSARDTFKVFINALS